MIIPSFPAKHQQVILGNHFQTFQLYLCFPSILTNGPTDQRGVASVVQSIVPPAVSPAVTWGYIWEGSNKTTRKHTKNPPNHDSVVWVETIEKMLYRESGNTKTVLCWLFHMGFPLKPGFWQVSETSTVIFLERRTCDSFRPTVNGCQWPFQEPKLEVPTIYKAYIISGTYHI